MTYIVYTHSCPATHKIMYVGCGSKKRAFAKDFRNKLWKSWVTDNPDYIINIVSEFKLKQDAHCFEFTLIEELKPTLNVKTKDTFRNKLDVHLLNELFYIDDTSDSGLRHKIDNKGQNLTNRKVKNSVAGSKKFQRNGIPHGWQIQIKGKCYLVHRIIYAILKNVDLVNNTVIDHIDRNPFNNNVVNLREVDYSENNRNRSVQSTNKLGIKYLHMRDKTYFVQYSTNGKRRYKSFSVSRFGENAACLAKQFLMEQHG